MATINPRQAQPTITERLTYIPTATKNAICALAGKYGALVAVDDSHATGFIGKTGRGVHEHFNVMNVV